MTKVKQGITEAVESDKGSELDPKCISGSQEAFAITNRGEVIPCCWLDTSIQRKDMDYGMLTLASNLDDYDSIDEILLQDEWVQFRNNLRQGKGFALCHHVCKKRDTPQHKKMTILSEGDEENIWTKAT
jgi:hypothetical protein